MNGREFGDHAAGHAERQHLPAQDASPLDAPGHPAGARRRARRLGPMTRALVIGVCVWSFVVIPWEVHGSFGVAQTLALLFSKALLVVLVVCTLRGVRGARVLFTFVCAVSVIAIGLDLPLEYNVLRTGFYLSLVDCVLKFAAALALVAHYTNRDGS
ncbi:hypothetical protein FAZ95_30975 [Trinickia violacea]|uniref:Uncharacterized protein n=1 Tax=Trinickia violacea TaxID=2571746 RepID=A0A4P8IVX0_9BURK|nr:hypothetical protein [Trinickia violacea]QCP53468.1 hypothetical protein FAZ95_30975 [Trinickia violacea]